MDSSIVSTALVAIGTYFDDFIRVQWVVLAFLLTDLGKLLLCSSLQTRASVDFVFKDLRSYLLV
jgi:hypothetical protein